MNSRRLFLVPVLAALLAVAACTTRTITSPKQEFGHEAGADYVLLNYTQVEQYFKKIADESDRVRLVDIGKTAEGRTMWMAVITSPENQKNLDRYREISRRLALAEGLTDEEADRLAAEGKAVVWSDGGLHASEVVNAQQEVALVYQLASRNDPETLRFLDDLVILTTISNPDGLQLVADWYMREPDPKKRSTGGLPRLYHKYVGHDNNRDFYMVNMPETEAVCKVLYHDWFPQIVYNKHQTGPVGTVLFAPPFRPLYNYYLDPMISTEIDLVGAAIHNRFVAEEKPGAVTREMFSTWWNGGFRTNPYFHNQIGLLTEINGNPTPQQIPLVPDRILPDSNYPYPIAPQKEFHFRQAIDYITTVDRAVFDVASRYRKDFLYNMYLMGKRSIERGSEDHWTFLPHQVEQLKETIEQERQTDQNGEEAGYRADYFRRGVPYRYYEMLKDPARRDPRGYIIPSDQPDFQTATRFVNALIENGIAIERATDDFEAGGKRYPKGSYVVKTAQAFRPHILDMFEPQDHPDDIPCPGGPPSPPYDSAGWTLAFQMGVRFDRILEGFEGPFERIEGLAEAPAGEVIRPDAPGFLLSHEVNDSVKAVNRLLADPGRKIYWLEDPVAAGGRTFPPGTIYIPADSVPRAEIEALADDLHLRFEGVDAPPKGGALELKPMHIGLWDRYGGSSTSGWIRWMLEQYDFDFEVVYPPALDAGGLAGKFDVIIFPDGAIQSGERRRDRNEPDPESIPAEYRNRLGAVTVDKTVPQLKQYLEEGGAIVAIGGSTSLAYQLGLPVTSALLDRGTQKPLGREKFFVPGSILRVRVDGSDPLAYGLPENLDVFFDNSPVFNARPGIRRVAWFDSPQPLRSGWAWGQQYLEGGSAVLDASVGGGRLFLFGPLITFRAQPHGTFKFLFNGIYLGGTRKVKL